MEALEVFALTSDMQRATGSIPYTSLMWDRKYYEPGSFLMELPANIYDPSWAYIYTDERPETGIIQKVEYSDTATTAGGVDTVILSGFFLEHELNRYTFLVEETEDEAYRIYKPSPAKTKRPTMWSDNLGMTYVKTGDKWETIDGDYVDPSTINQSELSEIDVLLGDGMQRKMYPTSNTGKYPSGFWSTGEYSNSNYAYYSSDGKTLHSVAPDGTETTYGIVSGGGTGDVIYEDEDGFHWVNGVASSLNDTYVRAAEGWESMVHSEGLEVVEGDNTIFGGSTYARAYRTVKGPWQLRTDLDVNEPADNVQRIIQWAQDIWGNNLLYDEVGFAGEEKIIDPSLKLFGDLAYEELKTIGASPRLFYSFESDTCVFQVWRGLDRTQSQAGVPAPPSPDEPEPDEPTIDELYEPLDYIVSTGEQYIDTGVIPNQSTRTVLDFRAYNVTTNRPLFGVRTGSKSKSHSVWVNSDGIYAQYGSNAWDAKPISVNPNQRLTYDFNANAMTAGGVTVSFDSATFDADYSVFLGTVNVSGSPDSRIIEGKLYGCRIYADGTALTQDLMPYRRKADGVFGLLDLVNEVFYESASGVPFTGPSYAAGTYEELDYIVSTGTQWIDTGFKPNQNTGVTLDFQLTETPNDWLGLFSARDGASANWGNSFSMWVNSSGQYRSDYGTNVGDPFGSADNNRHVIVKEGAAVSLDGTLVCTNTANTFQSNYTLHVCTGWTDGASEYPVRMRVFALQVRDNSNLTRDFVPRRRVSDGAVGMLDLVNDTFYTSAGSEPFLAPGELPSGYTRLEYIESTGSQYIDTGIYPNQDTGLEMAITPLSTDNTADGAGCVPYGAGTALGVSNFECYSQASQLEFNYNASKVYIGSPVAGQQAIISQKKNVASIVTGGTASTHTFDSGTFTSGTTLHLFGLHRSSGHFRGLMRLEWCVIDSNGTPVRNYVPVKDSGGEAGLFDLVTMAFYADVSGTGFVAGPEVAQVAAVAEVSAFALTRTVAASGESNTAANPFAVFSDTWGTLYGFTASKDVSNYRNTCYVLYQFRDQTDADGNPIGPRGFVKARLEDELPDAETYLDLRGEEPEEGQTDEAFIESLRQRGLAHLQANYAAIESLDTGTLAGNGYLDGYDLGDKVDMLVEAIGLVKEARITGVCEVHETGSSTATLEIGEQKLTNIRKAVIV